MNCHICLHYYMAYDSPCIARNYDLYRLLSAMVVNFLSLLTMGIHSLNCFRLFSYFFLYSSIDFVYLKRSYLLFKKSVNPSMVKILSPFKLAYKLDNWLSICFKTIKRRPRVYLPD
jgi:hypothetical protein